MRSSCLRFSAVLIALASASGCSRPESAAPDDTATAARADSPSTAPAHDMAAMDSVSGDSAPGMPHGPMPGMDHGAAAPAGGHQAMDHAARPPASRHAGMDHGPAAGGAPDHARMPGMRHEGPARAGHAGHTRAGRGVSPDHAGMGHGNAASPGMRHGGGHAPVRPSEHAGMTGMRHDGARETHAVHPGSQAASAADDKLLRLAAELVQDPAVRARIEADSALRGDWRDAGVRRVITGQAP